MKKNIFYLFSLINILTVGSAFVEELPASSHSGALFANSCNDILESKRACILGKKIKDFFTGLTSKPMRAQPNILVFIFDEQRFPTAYETEELRAWKKKNLVFQTMLESKGYVFHNYYTNTNACCPARATLQTGHYPNVHGVSQTDGIAKTATDPGMSWLEPFTVPTIGNYLREVGYKTIFKGKWHITDSAIRLKDGSYLTTYDGEGNAIPELYQFYLEKNVLDDYGYDGWVGPEPHGSAPLNSGSSINPNRSARDVKYTHELVDELENLTQEKKPWLLMASYVNPHDIAVYGVYAQMSKLFGGDWDFPVDETLPAKLFTDDFARSVNESLEDKPAVQASYRDVYPRALQPIPDLERYQRYYYTLQKQADENMLQVWNKLVSTPMYENTIVLLLSDHGELLGSHGKMFQKWHQAYQESIHIPLVIASPLFGNQHHDIYDLASHIDILPTLLSFAKADPEAIRQKLGEKFSLNLPLPGKSLYPLIHNPKATKINEEPIYFYSEDNPTLGLDAINPICQPYEPVIQPSSVEAVLTHLDDELWKITHYYSAEGMCAYNALGMTGITYEMYNVTKDPMELENLYENPDYSAIKLKLSNLLYRKAIMYRSVEPNLMTTPTRESGNVLFPPFISPK